MAALRRDAFRTANVNAIIRQNTVSASGRPQHERDARMMSSFEQLLDEARKMAAAHRALRSNGELREADAWFMKTEREGLLRGARFVALAPEQQLAVLKALDGEADAAAEKAQHHTREKNIWKRARLRGSEVPDRQFVDRKSTRLNSSP